MIDLRDLTPEDLDLVLLSVPTKSGGRTRIAGHYVPGTNELMFVYEMRGDKWSIIHAPTAKRLIWVDTFTEALVFGGEFYAAARAEGINLDSTNADELKPWLDAINTHIPDFGAVKRYALAGAASA